jgi:Uma2 family endonuclease
MPVDPARHRRLTYDDFVQFPDDGLRHEIIDGEHHVTPSPNLRHQDLVGRLHLSLGGFLEDRPERGRVFLSPFDVVFSFHDVVEPDLVFVAPDQPDILTDKNIQGAPALVVEILSPSTRMRDEQVKRRLYERTGVREYWLVNPDRGAVIIYRRAADGSFPQVAEATAQAHDTLMTPLLPGWSLALARLFR